MRFFVRFIRLSWLKTLKKKWTVYSLPNQIVICKMRWSSTKPVVDANWRLVSFLLLTKNDAPVTDTFSNSEIRKLKCDSDEMICVSRFGCFHFLWAHSTTNLCKRHFIHDKFLVHLQNRSHFTCRVLNVEMTPVQYYYSRDPDNWLRGH